jgi:hypothetical protein
MLVTHHKQIFNEWTNLQENWLEGYVRMPVGYLFICGVFNDAVSSSNYTAPNDMIINEKLIVKDMKKGLVA